VHVTHEEFPFNANNDGYGAIKYKVVDMGNKCADKE
jgi:hypothetical protein